jgi:hypothetical protein
MNIIQENAQKIMEEANKPDPDLNKISYLAREVERLSTGSGTPGQRDFSLSLPMRIIERQNRFKIDIPEDDKLMIQDCLKFHKFRGGQIQFSLGRPSRKAIIFSSGLPEKRQEIAAGVI